MSQQEIVIPAQLWDKAVQRAARLVERAAEQAARVYALPDGVNKKLETVTWQSLMDDARGSIATLRVFQPEDPRLEELTVQLNHAPVVVLKGPDYRQPQVVQ